MARSVVNLMKRMHSASNETLNRLAMALRTVQVDALVRNPVAQQIAGHQQVAGEVVGLALVDADGVDAGVDALVAVEALLLTAMEDEVANSWAMVKRRRSGLALPL